jgi:hypothetical protein
MFKSDLFKKMVVAVVLSIAIANVKSDFIYEGFEYSTSSELYNAGWSHIFGSPGDMIMADSNYNSRLPRSGSYSLLSPGDKTPNVVEKTFFSEGVTDATVEFYLLHRPISNLNAARSLIYLRADDGSYMQLYINQANGNLLYKLNGGTQTSAIGSIIKAEENDGLWNKFTIDYSSGAASVYLNDQLQFTWNDAHNFSSIAFGRSWTASSAVQSAYDDLSIEYVPEPVSALLLGCGAFFLRRRKYNS